MKVYLDIFDTFLKPKPYFVYRTLGNCIPCLIQPIKVIFLVNVNLKFFRKSHNYLEIINPKRIPIGSKLPICRS